MKAMLVICAFLVLLVTIEAYDVICTPCHERTSTCTPPVNCTYGVVVEYCECCTLCAKGEGESCHGFFGGYGICGEDFECSKPIIVDHDVTDQSPGICVRKPVTTSG